MLGIFGVDRQRGMRNGTKTFFGDKRTCFATNTISFVLDPDQGSFEVLYKLLLTLGQFPGFLF